MNRHHNQQASAKDPWCFSIQETYPRYWRLYQTPIFLPKEDWSFLHGEYTKIFCCFDWIKATAQNLQPLHAQN